MAPAVGPLIDVRRITTPTQSFATGARVLMGSIQADKCFNIFVPSCILTARFHSIGSSSLIYAHLVSQNRHRGLNFAIYSLRSSTAPPQIFSAQKFIATTFPFSRLEPLPKTSQPSKPLIRTMLAFTPTALPTMFHQLHHQPAEELHLQAVALTHAPSRLISRSGDAPMEPLSGGSTRCYTKPLRIVESAPMMTDIRKDNHDMGEEHL